MRQLLYSFATSMLLLSQPLFSLVLHNAVETNETVYEWTVDETLPFDELVVSWNSARPTVGEYTVHIRVKLEKWTEGLLYAVWGVNEQRTFTTNAENQLVRTNEDTVELLGGKKATGFAVKIEAKNGASLKDLWALHASLCDVASFRERIAKDISWKGAESVLVPVLGRSQMALVHPRNMDLCSPTSTSAVISCLKDKNIEATEFAAKVWDAGFDIYGNWIFSVAQSASFLGKPWQCYMARFDSFEQIYANLKRGVPTVVSVRGELPGAMHPYAKGHLIAVIGYDGASDSILCMDPAYQNDQDTLVSYSKKDFLQACARRGYIGYFFDNLLVVAPI